MGQRRRDMIRMLTGQDIIRFIRSVPEVTHIRTDVFGVDELRILVADGTTRIIHVYRDQVEEGLIELGTVQRRLNMKHDFIQAAPDVAASLLRDTLTRR